MNTDVNIETAYCDWLKTEYGTFGIARYRLYLLTLKVLTIPFIIGCFILPRHTTNRILVRAFLPIFNDILKFLENKHPYSDQVQILRQQHSELKADLKRFVARDMRHYAGQMIRLKFERFSTLLENTIMKSEGISVSDIVGDY